MSLYEASRDAAARAALVPSLSLSHSRATRPISLYSPRFFVAMLAFSSVLRYHAVDYRVKIENCVFLDTVQKKREADDNYKFTKYVVKEITLPFSIFQLNLLVASTFVKRRKLIWTPDI